MNKVFILNYGLPAEISSLSAIRLSNCAYETHCTASTRRGENRHLFFLWFNAIQRKINKKNSMNDESKQMGRGRAAKQSRVAAADKKTTKQ